MSTGRPTDYRKVLDFVPVAELPAHWLAQAEYIRPYAPAAVAWEKAASKLERALTERGREA